jgi:hypothetical protein
MVLRQRARRVQPRVEWRYRPSLRDWAFLHRDPGTPCLATISLSLRDKSIEAPHNYLSAYGVTPGLSPRFRLWPKALPRQSDSARHAVRTIVSAPELTVIVEVR